MVGNFVVDEFGGPLVAVEGCGADFVVLFTSIYKQEYQTTRLQDNSPTHFLQNMRRSAYAIFVVQSSLINCKRVVLDDSPTKFYTR